MGWLLRKLYHRLPPHHLFQGMTLTLKEQLSLGMHIAEMDVQGWDWRFHASNLALYRVLKHELSTLWSEEAEEKDGEAEEGTEAPKTLDWSTFY